MVVENMKRVRSRSEPLQNLRMFQLNALQFAFVQAERAQDSRSDLPRADRVSKLCLLELRVANEASYVSVVIAQATMFGDLRGRRSVDDALRGSNDDVWDGGII